MFSRGLVEIPDHRDLVRELTLLERRTGRLGKDSVNHGPHGSDDFANALFGAMYLAASRKRVMQIDQLTLERAGQPYRPWG